jgi:hypothetical protein
MRCDRCNRAVDTDYDLEGKWGDTTYTCEACCEREEEDASQEPAERAA